VWEFLSRFDRPTHLGFGKTNTSKIHIETYENYGSQVDFSRMAGRSSVNSPHADDKKKNEKNGQSSHASPEQDQRTPGKSHRKRSHYGNPRNGCRADEAKITFDTGDKNGVFSEMF
jgi:hypothetical protein